MAGQHNLRKPGCIPVCHIASCAPRDWQPAKNSGRAPDEFETKRDFNYQGHLMHDRRRCRRHSRTRRKFAMVTAVLAVSSAGFGSACNTPPLGASDPNLAMAKDENQRGAELFAQRCAGCHGERGQGKNGPSVMGPGALPEYPRDKSDSSQSFTDPQELENQVQTRPPGTPSREPFNSAGDVFNYVSKNMPLPKDQIGSLPPADYWAVVSFMLTAHGSAVPEGGVTPQNADSIEVEPP
jgi:mono/diheme cytochrome c family protein